jgi:hypothetical protein
MWEPLSGKVASRAAVGCHSERSREAAESRNRDSAG